MRSFRTLVYSSDLPITLEAPLIRGRGQLENFIESFRGYGLDRWVIGINTLNNPMGRVSSDPVITGFLIQSRLGVEAIPHISVSMENAYTMARWLIGASLHNIRNLLMLGGDVKIGNHISFVEALELARGFSRGEVRVGEKIYRVEPWEFFLGGALLPERGDEHQRVVSKMRNGIRFFQTQVIFEPGRLSEVLASADSLMGEDMDVPVLVSIIPYLDERIVRIFGPLIRASIDDFTIQSNHKYLSYIEGVLKEVMDRCDSLDRVKMGIHFIPIVWREESIANICELIDRF